MKITIIRTSIIAAITVLSLTVIGTASVANAHELEGDEAHTTMHERKETAQATVTDKKAAAQDRLADAKLKACENRQASITNIMARIGDRGQKQIDLFTKISDRVQAFYVEKGNTLATYDSLVTAATDAKTKAQTAVDDTKATTVEFDCDGDNPRGVAETFKANAISQKAAIKDYKTAVKNLIVGVKSVQSTTNETETTQENE